MQTNPYSPEQLLYDAIFPAGTETDVDKGLKVIASARQRHRGKLKKADRLMEEGDEMGAAAIWKRYLEETPNDAIVAFNVGVVMKHQGETPEWRHEAGKYFTQVVTNPLADLAHKADALNNLGILMEKSGYTEQALKAYDFALKMKPDHAAAMVNFGDALRCLGDVHGANEAYHKVLGHYPNSAEANYNSGYIALLLGEWERGWKSYLHRHRMKAGETTPIVSKRPYWNGESLAGKTLMLTEEQGYGDGFMGIRFAQCFAAQGARVVWGAQECMRDIMRGVPGVSACVSRDDATEFDYHLPQLDAPHWLKINETNIPQPPYLHVCEDWPKWNTPKASGRPRVGLIWAGSPRHGRDKARSIAPELLQPIIDDHPELDFYSLQFGPAADQVLRLQNVSHDILMTIHGWTYTAQALQWLDLLISVDTGPVHLAGAMNRPVFMLCPHSPDWRWLLGRETSPWYPAMRLFRQPNKDDWRTPIAAINGALVDFSCQKASDGLAVAGCTT